MGSGIAQLAARSGARTLLHDPLPEALSAGPQHARDGLAKEAARGRLSPEEADAAAARASSRSTRSRRLCRLRARDRGRARAARAQARAVCAAVARSSAEDCVLATNTSSLLVTAIAAGATHPERVVGMHFFNPAPLMRLLEVVAGEQSSEQALALARATGEAMGKTVDRGAGRARLPRQPLQPPVRAGGVAALAGAASPTSRRSTGRCASRAAFAWARSS